MEMREEMPHATPKITTVNPSKSKQLRQLSAREIEGHSSLKPRHYAFRNKGQNPAQFHERSAQREQGTKTAVAVAAASAA